MSQLRLVAFFVVLAVVVASWGLTCAAWYADRVVAGVAPLDARRFDAFTLVTVGTGGAFANPRRLGPATALALRDRVVLVDAGRGVAEGLRRAKIPARQVDGVYLTNLLPENTEGLDDLLLSGWLDGRSAPLRVVGPPGARALAASLEAAHASGIDARAAAQALPREGARFDAREVAGGFAEERGGIAARAAELPGGPLPTLAWRFEASGRSAVVSGSGWSADALVALARGADLLVHEAVYIPSPEVAAQAELEILPEELAREARLHTKIEDVGPLAQRAGVATLVLVRLRPPPVFSVQLTSQVDDAYAGRIAVADDGDEFRP